ncbi:soluble lytic murein transglycosylase [Clostridium algifaecis]|uniref:Soluble lytic murein transglycosylase n=1 Tax=Clostridium algifaecis TaxID=1472040 RepID=A0ABS4KSG1_9CLOT|nr:lytic transglycosylase domain-containing protein [Clostridium algifaecis]MBP2032980.1 soluble lytic murein transglycosylase [Clostridium algifaecis]
MKFAKRLLTFILILFIVLNAKNIVKHFYPLKYSEYIKEYSQEYNLDPYFIMAIIKTESGFKENVKSNKDAIGLMQITPDTASWAAQKMGIYNFRQDMLEDPKFNINMGCWYINNLKTEFNGNMDLVLAAYNGGRGNVQKWLKESEHSSDGKNLHYIPFKETDKYVKKVNVSYKLYKYIYK